MTEHKQPEALESLVVAARLPFLRPARFLAIFAIPVFIFYLITLYFPGANFMSDSTHPLEAVAVGPLVAIELHGWKGGVIWVFSVLAAAFCATAWSIEVALGEKMPLWFVLRAGFSRSLHYLVAHALILILPFAPIFLAMALLASNTTPDPVALSWQEPRAWLFGFLLLLALPALWVILRLLLLPPRVALLGWRHALPSAWRASRGLAFRFAALITLVSVAGIFIMLPVASSLMENFNRDELAALIDAFNLLNLAGSVVFMILIVGMLAAHLPSDRFLHWEWSNDG